MASGEWARVDSPSAGRYPKLFSPRLAVKLKVNGQTREVPDGWTIRALLESLDLAAEQLAVEVNTEVVRRARHAEHRLTDGDEVEIVTFVGGG